MYAPCYLRFFSIYYLHVFNWNVLYLILLKLRTLDNNIEEHALVQLFLIKVTEINKVFSAFILVGDGLNRGRGCKTDN